jgi:hypothetical protein
VNSVQPTQIPGDVAPTGSALGTVADLWACSQVVLWFTAHFDAGEYAEMEQYFAPDGVWFQARGPIHGRGELRERMASMPADQVMRHVLTNLRPTFISADQVLVDSYFTVYLEPRPTGVLSVPTAGARNVGRYRDTLRKIDGHWLLSERSVHFDLKLSPSPT